MRQSHSSFRRAPVHWRWQYGESSPPSTSRGAEEADVEVQRRTRVETQRRDRSRQALKARQIGWCWSGGKVEVKGGFQRRGKYGQRQKPRKRSLDKAVWMRNASRLHRRKKHVPKGSFQGGGERLRVKFTPSQYNEGPDKRFIHDPPKYCKGK